MTIKAFGLGPPSSAIFVDGGKISSHQGGWLPIPQVPIKIMNVWYGRPDEIMDLLPLKEIWI